MLTGEEKRSAFQSANIFVLSSYSETFGVSILEAMSYRLPVIISNACNLSSTINKHKAGMVINPNEEDLTEAIIKILNDPELSQKMGENGKRLVEEKYTWDKIADQMTNLYKNAIKDKTDKKT